MIKRSSQKESDEGRRRERLNNFIGEIVRGQAVLMD